jgi:hypothetical protein
MNGATKMRHHIVRSRTEQGTAHTPLASFSENNLQISNCRHQSPSCKLGKGYILLKREETIVHQRLQQTKHIPVPEVPPTTCIRSVGLSLWSQNSCAGLMISLETSTPRPTMLSLMSTSHPLYQATTSAGGLAPVFGLSTTSTGLLGLPFLRCLCYSPMV